MTKNLVDICSGLIFLPFFHPPFTLRITEIIKFENLFDLFFVFTTLLLNYIYVPVVENLSPAHERQYPAVSGDWNNQTQHQNLSKTFLLFELIKHKNLHNLH